MQGSWTSPTYNKKKMSDMYVEGFATFCLRRAIAMTIH